MSACQLCLVVQISIAYDRNWILSSSCRHLYAVSCQCLVHRETSCALPLLPKHCKFVVLVLHLITCNDTYSLGRTPLEKGSATCRENTKHTQQIDIHALSGIRNRNPRKRAAQTHVLDRAAIGIGVRQPNI